MWEVEVGGPRAKDHPVWMTKLSWAEGDWGGVSMGLHEQPGLHRDTPSQRTKQQKWGQSQHFINIKMWMPFPQLWGRLGFLLFLFGDFVIFAVEERNLLGEKKLTHVVDTQKKRSSINWGIFFFTLKNFLFLCVVPHIVTPTEARKGCWVLWNWSHVWLEPLHVRAGNWHWSFAKHQGLWATEPSF